MKLIVCIALLGVGIALLGGGQASSPARGCQEELQAVSDALSDEKLLTWQLKAEVQHLRSELETLLSVKSEDVDPQQEKCGPEELNGEVRLPRSAILRGCCRRRCCRRARATERVVEGVTRRALRDTVGCFTSCVWQLPLLLLCLVSVEPV